MSRHTSSFLPPFHAAAVLAALSTLGCLATDVDEDVDEGGQAVDTPDQSKVYLLAPALDESEWDQIKWKVGRDRVVGPAIGSGRLGVRCAFDVGAQKRLCSIFFPYRTADALALPEAGKAELSFDKPVTFTGPVALAIWEGIATFLTRNDAEQHAGPVSCVKRGETASCAIAPSPGGPRSYTASTLAYWTEADMAHVPRETMDEVAALAR
jgi:hypothetical protein